MEKETEDKLKNIFSSLEPMYLMIFDKYKEYLINDNPEPLFEISDFGDVGYNRKGINVGGTLTDVEYDFNREIAEKVYSQVREDERNLIPIIDELIIFGERELGVKLRYEFSYENSEDWTVGLIIIVEYYS